jgi:agmatine/peptidylarginine deiminase
LADNFGIGVPSVGEGLAAILPYANFYIANDAVIVPHLNQETWDSWAVATLQSLFSGRQMVGVHLVADFYWEVATLMA